MRSLGEGGLCAKAPRVSRRAAARRRTVVSSSSEEDEEDSSADQEDSDVDSEEAAFGEEDVSKAVVTTKARERTNKQVLIAQVLARWWYVMNPWPPEDFDYDEELGRRSLRRVPIDQWETADDVDSEGRCKVYEISHFPGIFRDPKGNAIDLRPMEGRPCYRNLAQLDEGTLRSMLQTALKKQLEELEFSPYVTTDREHVDQVKNGLQLRIKNLASNENGKI